MEDEVATAVSNGGDNTITHSTVTDDPDSSVDSNRGELLKSPQKDYYTQLHDNGNHEATNGNDTRSALETTDIDNNKTKKYRKKSSIVEEFLFQAKATMFSSGINICNANIGAGVLGLPFAVSDSGFLMAFFLFILFAFVSTFAFQLLMSVGSCYVFKGRVSSYAIVCNDIAPRLQIIIDIFIAFGFTLTCSAYLIIIGDYMPLVAREIGNYSSDSDSIIITREFWIFLFLIILILPTTALKKLDQLRFSSTIAICCFIYVTIIVILFALFPDADTFKLEDDAIGETSFLPTNALDFFEAAPLYVFAYGGHPLAFILTNELENPTLKRINITLINAFGFVTIVYAIVGVTGYATFGDQTATNILLNYPDDNIWIIIVRIGLSIAVAFSYPVLANSWKQSMASLLFRVDKYGKDANDLEWYKYYTLVAILIFATVIISMLTDDLGIVSKLQGSTAGTFLQIVAPGLIYYYYDKKLDRTMLDNKMHNFKWKGAILLIIFGFIMIPFATTLVFVDTY